MTPSNILQRTFQIKVGKLCGTCFTIDLNGYQYIITARHIVEGEVKSKTHIEIYSKGTWEELAVSIIGIGVNELDIAVLAANKQLSPCHPLIPTIADLYLSQDVYFLGFPLGIRADVDAKMNNSFPLPIIKKGIVSAINFVNGVGHSLLIDGLNNPGFSGGPVYYSPVGRSQEHCVAAVISGYKFNWEPIYIDGQITNAQFKGNTGIIIAYTINHAVDLIAKNRAGFRLDV